MSPTIPDVQLHKRYQILSFHFVRSIISQKWINLQHISSDYNASNILTKHWGYNVIWKTILRPLLHHQGDTRILTEDDTALVDRSTSMEKIAIALTINGEYQILQSLNEKNTGLSPMIDCTHTHIHTHTHDK